MNERIRELFEEHTVPNFSVGNNINLERNSKGEYINATLEDHWQTFQEAAELIVQECLDILEDEDTHDIYGQPIRLATIRIKKLFGVEEPEEDFACPLCGEDSGTTCGVPGCQY